MAAPGSNILYGGCRWAEGPAYFPAGRYLVWSDIPNDRMLRWDETDGTSACSAQPANNTNGHTVDRQGRLVTCEHGGRRVTRTEHDGTITVLADRCEGKRLNSPNDVVVKSDGSIWFTDPAYGIDRDYEGHRAESEIGACHVYRDRSGTGACRRGRRRLHAAQRPGLLARREASSTSPTPAPATWRTARGTSGSSTSTGRPLSGGEVFATCTDGLFDGFRLRRGRPHLD